MNTKPLISVVIPTYNYGEYIEHCIESVLSQTYRNFEILVVDDGSTDETPKILKKFGTKIIGIRTKNYGACIARNVGLNSASGEYVAFLDADDYWKPNFLEKLFSHGQLLNADLVYCDMFSIDESTKEIELVKSVRKVDSEWFHNNPGSTPFSPSTVLIRRGLLARTSGWNTSLKSPAEDFDFFRRCAKHGVLVHVEDTLAYHRNHPRSLTSRSQVLYFKDNVRATRIMLTEDRELVDFKDRLRCWLRLHLKFAKHATKNADYRLFAHVIKSLISI